MEETKRTYFTMEDETRGVKSYLLLSLLLGQETHLGDQENVFYSEKNIMM